MPKTKDEIIREIGDAYDYGDYGDAARLEELEGELAHVERLEGIAERMRQAGYADWEVAEEVAEADASWRGVRDNTEAHRTTGAFIPTTPRILQSQSGAVVDATAKTMRGNAEVPRFKQYTRVSFTIPAERLLEAFQKTGGVIPLKDLRASWEWTGDEDQLCLAVSFPTSSGGAILRSSRDNTLRFAWPDGPWSGDMIGADGWEDLTSEDVASMVRAYNLESFREFAVENIDALHKAPANREAMAARMATVYDDGVVMLPREVSESKLLEDYQEASPGRLPKDLTAAWEQEEDGRFCLALRFQERRGPLDLVSPKTVRLCASLADGSWSGCVESPYGWGGKGIAPERAAETAERIGLEGFRAFAFDALESFAFSQLVAAPADREATAFEAMLGDASAQAARENAPLAQQAPQASEKAR